jgi:Ca2+-binding EF-hand superfamily protein
MGCSNGREVAENLRASANGTMMSKRNYFNGRLKESQIKKNIIEEKNLKEVIDDIYLRFDKNQDGYLSSKEIEEFVKHSFTKTAAIKSDKQGKNKENKPKSSQFYQDAANRLIKSISNDKNDKISKEELYEFYKKNPQPQ